MEVILISIVAFALIMLAMAVGVIFRRPCLRGSCGGPEVLGPNGESLSCATCPNRKKNRGRAAASDDGGGLPVVR